MSDKLDHSNEETVSEITQDLENQLKNQCRVIEADNENESRSESNDEADFDSDDQSSEDEEPGEISGHDDDFIDEDQLKELEKTLNDEEIERRKEQALELKKRGNQEYKEQKYFDSVSTYTEALRICPTKYTTERSIFYANRAASKINIDRKKSAIDDCTKSIAFNDRYVRAYLRRAKLYEEDDKLEESLEDYKKVLEMDPVCVEALSASQRLPPKITEKNEKLKEEMLGKLKDLGNLILRPFGLSTDNFKLEQNAETGGYSINFNQNKGGSV
ncbi:hypothetical protein HHI36_008967 [Cryptolaemus montrouzieri]|uniref:Tetratricopeptide repeat protein 1 n=1 Tax=Cryptolaemus montrouzieri TaxID=559131 RepID=A0ABD2MTX6_9CUCU